ncbi:glycosyltransferase [Stenotrophomonas sp.]|uniref:glycosyltransferase family 4 protein n=1 Tax=Stenotrophomonas sp. TaxID=69392 RepID=UPI002FC764E4
MIRRLYALARRVSVRQLLANPRAELGRILGWVGRRLQGAATVVAHGHATLPAWLDAEMIALASIEPELLGEKGSTAHYRHYGVPMVTRPGELYRQIVDAVGERPCSHVMIIPWLVRGGADRGALYHLQAWVDAMPAADVLVILTDDIESPWLDRIPAGIRVLPFGRIAGSMAMEGKVQLLTRLLLQMQPSVIHTINSRVAWEAYRKFGLALRQRSTLFASLFCDDQDENGVPVGYARSYLRSCFQHLTSVFCDNSVYPARWSVELGVPRDLFTVLPFPYDRAVVIKEDAFPIEGQPRVLWAGRLDRQKRPDILVAIARAMPDVGFDVHGVSELGAHHPAIDALRRLPNVTMHGAFPRFEGIVKADHAAYLFTTSWEGLPTILLDAAAAGIPIVAPAVGGIVDLIRRDWLVALPDDVDAYVDRLRQLLSDPGLRSARRREQYAGLSTGRDWADFTRILRGIHQYLPERQHETKNMSNQGSTT